MKFKVGIAVIASALVFNIDAPAQSPLTIGSIDNSTFEYLDGAGCYFRPAAARPDPKNQQYTFLRTLTKPYKGWVSVGGKVVALTQEGEFIDGEKTGSQHRETFRNGTLSVSLIGFVKEAGYEERVIEADLEVSDGKQVARAKVRGSCGS